MNTAEFKGRVLAELAWRFPHARIEFEEKLGFGTSTQRCARNASGM